jgi:hypothetical protein
MAIHGAKRCQPNLLNRCHPFGTNLARLFLYNFKVFSRKAFAMTDTELSDIAAPAIMGLKEFRRTVREHQRRSEARAVVHESEEAMFQSGHHGCSYGTDFPRRSRVDR